MRLIAFLRSRRLAATLLVGMTVYTWVSTLVPLESVDPAAVRSWDAAHPVLAVVVGALGLHRAYSNPVFILAAALLIVSTATCAWERTAWTVRRWRARGLVSPGLLDRMHRAPTFTLSLPPDEGERCLDDAGMALRRMLPHVRVGRQMVEAEGGLLGVFGSPVFHWALAALFLVAGLGQLTRYEGFTNVVVGRTVSDEAASYTSGYYPGPLFSGKFSGLQVGVKGIDANFRAQGVARGATPLVRLGRGRETLAEQWVYPNAPLRYGSLMIHARQTGRALVASFRQGGAGEPLVLYYPPGTKTARFAVRATAAAPTSTVEISAVRGQRLLVSVSDDSRVQTRTVGVGDTVRISHAASFTVDALTGYAQLKVVNDWSVPWLYGLFALGTAAITLTVFVHPRTVRALLSRDETGPVLHVLVERSKMDPAFTVTVERELKAYLGFVAAAEEEVS